jgi:hypothetical protein
MSHIWHVFPIYGTYDRAERNARRPTLVGRDTNVSVRKAGGVTNVSVQDKKKVSEHSRAFRSTSTSRP